MGVPDCQRGGRGESVLVGGTGEGRVADEGGSGSGCGGGGRVEWVSIPVYSLFVGEEGSK